MTEAVYTVREVADLLRCSTQTIYRSIDAGQLPAVRLMGVVRVPVHALAGLTVPHNSESATPAASSLCSATDRVDAAGIGGAGSREDSGACGEVGATNRAVGTARPLSH